MLPLSGFAQPITWPEDNHVQDRKARLVGLCKGEPVADAVSPWYYF